MLPKIGKIVLECSVDGIEKGFLNEDLKTIEQVKAALRADAALNEEYDKASVRHSSCSAQALAQETFTGRVDSRWHSPKCPQCKHNAAVVAAIESKEDAAKEHTFSITLAGAVRQLGAGEKSRDEKGRLDCKWGCGCEFLATDRQGGGILFTCNKHAE